MTLFGKEDRSSWAATLSKKIPSGDLIAPREVSHNLCFHTFALDWTVRNSVHDTFIQLADKQHKSQGLKCKKNTNTQLHNLFHTAH